MNRIKRFVFGFGGILLLALGALAAVFSRRAAGEKRGMERLSAEEERVKKEIEKVEQKRAEIVTDLDHAIATMEELQIKKGEDYSKYIEDRKAHKQRIEEMTREELLQFLE